MCPGGERRTNTNGMPTASSAAPCHERAPGLGPPSVEPRWRREARTASRPPGSTRVRAGTHAWWPCPGLFTQDSAVPLGLAAGAGDKLTNRVAARTVRPLPAEVARSPATSAPDPWRLACAGPSVVESGPGRDYEVSERSQSTGLLVRAPKARARPL